ncbi:MAG: AAA family ATPase [Nitrososphaeraceae archaeon]|nr:AAA family ATPase [Nitrososphaeraceae archaeon]
MNPTSIAFHSYKGGTGKTTIACNFAAQLAKRGNRVGLLDLDIYAPSIQTYFEIEPKRWLNNYLNSSADLAEVIIDGNQFVSSGKVNPGNYNSKEKSTNPGGGNLWLGFSNPRSEEILQLETTGTSTAREILKKLILLKEKMLTDLRLDYLIIDTSPGIRTWSINALAVSDILLLTLKSGDIDSKGTKRLVEDIYDTFTRHGSKSYLLYNRVQGYCKPPKDYLGANNNKSNLSYKEGISGPAEENPLKSGSLMGEPKLSQELGIKTITSIPCFCDIQFSEKEFLTVLNYPEHPFSNYVNELITGIRSA